MPGDDVLLTVGEVAIAYAGFSSIVAVFGRRSVGEWAPIDIFRLLNLVSTSLGAALFALLPFGLRHLHLPETSVWVASSAMLAVFTVAFLVFSTWRGRQIFLQNPGSVRPGVAIVLYLSILSCLILQVLNIGGVLFQQELGPFLAGLLLLLLVSAIQFALLLFAPLSGKPAAP